MVCIEETNHGIIHPFIDWLIEYAVSLTKMVPTICYENTHT